MWRKIPSWGPQVVEARVGIRGRLPDEEVGQRRHDVREALGCAADLELPARPGPLGQRGQPRQLALAGELTGVGKAGGEKLLELGACGDLAFEHRVDQVGLHAVAGRDEPVLVQDLRHGEELR